MAAFHLAHGGHTPCGRRHTRASSRSCIAEVDDLEEERREEKRREKKFGNANGTRAYFAARRSSWNGCRRVEKRSRGSRKSRLFQVQGLEVVEPLTRTSVPFRSDLKEEIVLTRLCASTLLFTSFTADINPFLFSSNIT